MSRIELRDVGPRDGLQSEEPVAIERRVELVDALSHAGLSDIEAVSFVSPKAVPQMAGAGEVMASIERRAGVTYWALVPNRKGAELAVDAGADALTVTISACPVYNEKNIRQSVDDSLAAISDIVAVADGRVVDCVISCVFGSPYTGDEPTKDVPRIIARLADQGVNRVTLADTTGMATPTRVEAVIAATGPDVGLHLHDTRGTALVNAWTAMSLGVRRFDTAVGGLGGSPFAAGAGGNLATEDLVHLLDDAGIDSGIDLGELLETARLLRGMVGHDLPGRVATHGPRSVESAPSTTAGV
ncbi:MAG: hydroxymethylglutaryl-CoA lyase [Acidimicrobiales bacterium]